MIWLIFLGVPLAAYALLALVPAGAPLVLLGAVWLVALGFLLREVWGATPEEDPFGFGIALMAIYTTATLSALAFRGIRASLPPTAPPAARWTIFALTPVAATGLMFLVLPHVF
ncbi:MAG: hypothetical protein AAFV96_01515 [Pseudomonadota bacterium]